MGCICVMCTLVVAPPAAHIYRHRRCCTLCARSELFYTPLILLNCIRLLKLHISRERPRHLFRDIWAAAWRTRRARCEGLICCRRAHEKKGPFIPKCIRHYSDTHLMHGKSYFMQSRYNGMHDWFFRCRVFCRRWLVASCQRHFGAFGVRQTSNHCCTASFGSPSNNAAHGNLPWPNGGKAKCAVHPSQRPGTANPANHISQVFDHLMQNRNGQTRSDRMCCSLSVYGPNRSPMHIAIGVRVRCSTI